VILCTPTDACRAGDRLHEGGQARAGGNPLADSWADAEAVVAKQKETGLVCMVGHTRRFNPSHQYVHNKIKAGEFNIQQMDVQTYFFRRKNINAKGEARSGPTTCCGTTRPTRWTCSPTRPERSSRPMPSKGRSIRTGHRHGHVDPAQERKRRDLHALFRSTTMARSALLPLYRRHRHLYRALRRSGERQGRADRREPCRRVDERHRIADREFIAAIREGREPNSSVGRCSIAIGCWANWKSSSPPVKLPWPALVAGLFFWSRGRDGAGPGRGCE
jgi:2-hydroxy-4-carboxymuconate semialdehyde hemiacetal dehydrogenase